jgi:DNA-binding SARP family transcriptional activator
VLVRLLGPVDVLVEGATRSLSGPRATAVLAALAMHPGEIVSIDRLVDIVWGASAPPTAAVTLQSHVSRIRRVLGDRATIVARRPGYVLEASGEITDVQFAERLIRTAETGDPLDRERHLRAAVELWRDRPLADLAGMAWFDNHARRLEGMLLRARLALLDVRLALGRHAELVAELEQLARAHPLDERIHQQLMLALYRSGRQSEALAAYRQLRGTLDRELGIDPSQPLRELETAILRQDPALDVAETVPVQRTTPIAVPVQLPLAVAGFCGRTRELAALDRLPPTVPVTVISGTAGVGKTALAVYWAHQLAGRYPDGQLYVNLRGFDPAGPAVDPATAVRGFLDAFAVPAARIPPDLDSQVRLYRSLLTGKRVLVVLDNARDAEQLRPLLPGTPGSAAIVTSRAPIAVGDGAHQLALDLLSTVEARELLARRLGATRVAAEPGAVADIIALCVRLPLALVIAAASAAAHPDFPLAVVAGQLGASSALDALNAGDPVSDVRSVFSWSYRTVSDRAARLFRLIGLHPGPDISAPAAASLAGTGVDETRTLLAELVRAHLLGESTPGRYGCHDLLRAYAAEQAGTQDDERTRRAALYRMLDHYVHTAHLAARLLSPIRDSIVLPEPRAGVTPERLHDHDQALAWCTAEEPVLLAAVRLAAGSGFEAHAWRLAWALRTFLLRTGRWAEQIANEQTALEAARRTGDRAGEASALVGLALGLFRSGRLDEAEGPFRQAIPVYEEIEDLAGLANLYTALAELGEKQGRPDDSLRYSEQALRLYRRLGHQRGLARTLNGVGWSHALRGDHRQALRYCTEALGLLEQLGDRDGQRLGQPRLHPPRSRRVRSGRRLLPAGGRRVPGDRRPVLGGRCARQPGRHAPGCRRHRRRPHRVAGGVEDPPRTQASGRRPDARQDQRELTSEVLAAQRRFRGERHLGAVTPCVQLGERGAVGRDPGQLAGPCQRLGVRQRWHLDPGQAAARPDDGRVQPRQVLVRGDRHEHLAALADQPVGQVEQPGQRLPGVLLGLTADQLVAVLDQQQPPFQVPLVRARALAGLVQRDLHQVRGAAEQVLRIQYAVDLAPVAPLPGERPQDRGLSGAGRPVQQDDPATHRVAVQPHQPVELPGRAGRVVAPDVGPPGGRDRSGVALGAVWPGVPEAERDGFLDRIRAVGHPVGRLLHDLLAQLGGHRGHRDRGRPGPRPVHGPHRPAVTDREAGPLGRRRGLAQHPRARGQQRRVVADVFEVEGLRVRLVAGEERGQRERVDDVARRVGVVEREHDGQHGFRRGAGRTELERHLPRDTHVPIVPADSLAVHRFSSHRLESTPVKTGALLSIVLVLAACTHARDTGTKPADFVGFSSYPADGAAKLDPDQIRLAGPHFDLRFVAADVVTRTGELYLAAPGHEFLQLFVENPPRPGPYAGTFGATPPTVAVLVDGVKRSTTMPLGGITVSVPTGHDATLQVTDEGRTQSISMRHPARGDDAVAGYYRPHRLAWATASYDEKGTVSYRQARLTAEASVSLADASGSLEPWLPGLGWAKPGRVWLQLSHVKTDGGISVDNSERLDNLTLAYAIGLRYFVDPGTMLSVSFPGGQSKPVPHETGPFSGLDGVTVFDVPDSFAGGALVVDPPRTVDMLRAPGSVTWSKPLPARQIPLAVVAG